MGGDQPHEVDFWLFFLLGCHCVTDHSSEFMSRGLFIKAHTYRTNELDDESDLQ